MQSSGQDRKRWHLSALTYMSPLGQGSRAYLTRWPEEEYMWYPPSWVVDGTVGAGARNVPDWRLSPPHLWASGELLVHSDGRGLIGL